MATRIDSAKRIINGTYSQVWIDGRLIAECSACQGKVQKNKSTVNLCGQFMEDQKATSGAGTGSLTMYKVDSGAIDDERDLQQGVDRRFTIITNAADPDALGAERIAYYNCSFDDLTLADHRAATLGTITRPFTFSRYELLNLIEVQ